MPEKPQKKNLSAIESDPVPRIRSIEANGGEAVYPPIEIGAYLISYLWEVGPVSGAGFGVTAISFTELEAWQRLSCVELQPWEARTLRLLSADYAAESRKAEKPDCPPPYGAPTLEFDRDVVGKKVANALKAFVLAKKK